MRFAFLSFLTVVVMGCGVDRPPATSTEGEVDDEQVTITEAFCGYELTLPKRQAESFRVFLNENVSEEQIFTFLTRLFSNKRVDWRMKALAAIVAADVLLFKKKMNDNLGPRGVVIRVWGIEGQNTVCTTVAPGTGDWVLPNSWKVKKKVASTIPLYWTVTARR
jgi:hypothetical protein